MDADRLLEQIRHTIATMGRESVDRPTLHALATQVVVQFAALDGHLSGGGRPPTAWAEGPDAHLEHIADPLGGPIPGHNGSHLPD